jgi:hypothetical protein
VSPLHPKSSSPDSATGQESLLRPRRRGRFLKGPVPLDWLATAARLPGRALHVGIVIWFRSGLTKNRSVRLSRAQLAPFGIDRHTLRRALTVLEAAKLVSVTRGPGKSPVVTLPPAPGEE